MSRTGVKNTVRFVVAHFAAGTVCFVLSLVLLLLVCALRVRLVEMEDGWPVHLLFHLLTMCVVAALALAVGYGLAALALLAFRRWVRFSLWAPMAVALPALAALLFATLPHWTAWAERFVPGASQHLVALVFLAAVLTWGGFCVYWLVFFVSMAVIGPLQDLLIHTGQLTQGPSTSA